MQTDLKSFVVPNLVQGVSQQAAEQRRDTQCEEQFDCVNSPVNGCEARPPVEVLAVLRGVEFQNAFCRQIARGTEEHYLAVFANDAPGAKIKVFDLNNGEQCEVTFTASQDYLFTDDTPRDKLRAATLEDFTFVVNREVKPEIDPDVVAPNDYNEGICYFKAGGYKITFQCSIGYSGNIYHFKYESPDNSTAANAAYITTNQLAATFYRAFTGGTISNSESGSTIVAPLREEGQASYGGGVGGDAPPGQAATGDITLTSLGFYVALNGNCILIGRADDNPFTIDTSDGVGDTYFRSVKGQAQAFSDLPKNCFKGFTTKVKGSNADDEDDYWVAFKGSEGADGFWEECAQPGTLTDLRKATMPHALVNTGYQQFDWRQPDWQPRVSGDGEINSKNPSFVGKEIVDIFYSNSRLGMLTEGSAVWSVNRNPFTYYPSSAQSTLDTDPIDIQVGGGKEIALIRKAVQINESTFLWAEGLQFRINNNNDIFKQDSVQADPSTQYEFSSRCDPQPVGQSLYFATEPGGFSTLIDLSVKDGKPQGDTDVTGHVKKYVPSGIRHMAGSSTLNMLFVQSDYEPDKLFLYQFLLTTEERLQSAWNTWRLPAGCRVLWIGIRRNKLKMLVQIGTWGALLLQCDLSVDATDPGYEDYLTRMDFRMPEGLLIRAYFPETQTTKILLPFPVDTARGYVFSGNPDDCPMFVANRSTSDNRHRGHNWQIASIQWDDTFDCDVITVSGDCSQEELYVGLRIASTRTEGEFFLRSPQQGAIDLDRLQIVECAYTYSRSGYWRAEVTQELPAPRTDTYHMTGRAFGAADNIIGTHPIVGGRFIVPVNAESTKVRIKLINDSFLPSRWTRNAVHYRASSRAQQSGFGARTGGA
jgi:hypothetical protein